MVFHIIPLLLIRWGARKFKFCFLQLANLIGPSFKKMKLWRLPKIEGSTLMCRVLPLWPSYICEKRTTFAYAYGIKVRCYGEHVAKHIRKLRNIVGTWLEPVGNLKGTHWEQEKNWEKLKRKKNQGTLSACLGLPICCMKFLFPKESVTILGVG